MVTDDADTLDPREQRALRRLAMLETLAEIGVAMAHSVRAMTDLELERRADAAFSGAPPEPTGAVAELDLAYGRISRSVRLTMALEARLDAAPKPPAAQAVEQRADEKQRAAAGVAKMQRAFVNDALSRAIVDEAPESERENLLGDLHERLDDKSDEELFAELPTEQLIRRIGRDLGLTPAESDAVARACGDGPDEAEYAGRLAYGEAVVKAALANLGPLKKMARDALNAKLARNRSP
jgi:hypothetical protein